VSDDEKRPLEWRAHLARLRRFNLIRDLEDGSIAASDVLYPPGLS